jgi:hypothetical protein
MSEEDYHYVSIKKCMNGRWINLEDVTSIIWRDHEHSMSCGCNIDYKPGLDPRNERRTRF